MTHFVSVHDPAAAAEHRELMDRYDANERALAERWPSLLAEHEGEWVAIADGGAIVIRSTLRELIQALPGESLPTAVVRLIAESRLPRIW